MHAPAPAINAGDLERCTPSAWRSPTAGMAIFMVAANRYDLLVELPRGTEPPRVGTAVRLAPSLCAVSLVIGMRARWFPIAYVGIPKRGLIRAAAVNSAIGILTALSAVARELGMRESALALSLRASQFPCQHLQAVLPRQISAAMAGALDESADPGETAPATGHTNASLAAQDEGEKRTVAKTLEQIRRALQYGKRVHSRRITGIRAAKGMSEPGRLARRYRNQAGAANAPAGGNWDNKSERARPREQQRQAKSAADKQATVQENTKERHDVARDT